jgi:hypothetical protein
VAANEIYRFMATKTTYATVVPERARDQRELNRKVSQTFKANKGRATIVGEIAEFPLSTSIPNHLLCDGSEVGQLNFPELYAYLGLSQGTPAVATNFKLPNYIGTAAPAVTSPPQTVTTAGTVSTGGTVTPPTGAGQTGGTTGGNVTSGGRGNRIADPNPIP